MLLLLHLYNMRRQCARPRSPLLSFQTLTLRRTHMLPQMGAFPPFVIHIDCVCYLFGSGRGERVMLLHALSSFLHLFGV